MDFIFNSIIGRIANDPQLTHTDTGAPILTFDVNYLREFYQRGVQGKKNHFIDVVAYAEFALKLDATNRAEPIKGQHILIVGHLDKRDTFDANGLPLGKRMELVIDRYELFTPVTQIQPPARRGFTVPPASGQGRRVGSPATSPSHA
jgi:hypothetical protein